MMRWTVLFMMFACWGLATNAGAQVSAIARLDTTDILIGDQVELFVRVTCPDGVTLGKIGLDTFRQVRGLERVRAMQADTFALASGYQVEQKLILTSFDSGYYRLPPIPVSYLENGQTGKTLTNDLALMVRTIPVQSDTTRLQPIKGIWKEPLKVQDFWLVFAVAALALMVLLWLRYRKRRAKMETVPVAEVSRPAHLIALEKLDNLGQSGLLEQRAYKAYQSELTFIFREYLLNRYGLNALESTSDEIIQDLPVLGLDDALRQSLEQTLRRADLVKFAKAEFPAEAHMESWQLIRRFVETTQEVEDASSEEEATARPGEETGSA